MKKKFGLLFILSLLIVSIFVGRNKLAVVYYNRANNYLDRHLYKEAIKYFEKSISLEPSVAVVHYALANAYREEKDEDKAVAQYQKTIQIDNRFVWGYKALAQIYLNRHSYEEAMAIVDKAMKIVPDNTEIKDLMNYVSFEYSADLMNRSVSEFSSGDKFKAYMLLEKAVQLNPDFAFNYYTLGYFYYVDRKLDKAEQALDKSIQLDSKFFLAHKLLGDIYFENKIFQKAIDEYKSALEINARDEAALNNMGLSFMNLEKYGEAEQFLNKALSLNSGNVNIRYSLASINRDRGKLNEALSEYKNVISIQPDYPGVRNDIGDIYKQQGRVAEAVEEYRKEVYFCQSRLSKNPNDHVILTDIAHAYNGIGEFDKAKASIDKALVIGPDYRQAYLTLAAVEKNLGDYAAALAALEKAKGLTLQKYFFIEKQINDIKNLEKLTNDKLIFFAPDTVYLKNGRQLKGKIKEETKDSVILEMHIGSSAGTVNLLRSNIERIVSEKK